MGDGVYCNMMTGEYSGGGGSSAGYGINGEGLNGVYYNWYTNQYCSAADGSTVSWGYVFSNVVVPYTAEKYEGESAKAYLNLRINPRSYYEITLKDPMAQQVDWSVWRTEVYPMPYGAGENGYGDVIPNQSAIGLPSDALDYTGVLIGAGGTYFGVMGEGFHNNLYWIQKNGVLRSTNILNSTNKIYQTSYNIVGSTLKNTKLIGKGFSIAGSVVSTTQFISEPNLANAIDGVMGNTTYIPGVGWAISGVYYIGNIISETTTGRTLGTITVEGARYNPNNPVYPLVILFGH